MGGFLSFVHKEALHILRDSRTMLIVLVIPIVQIILFGFAISTEVSNIDVAIVAPHPSESIRRAAERIQANDYFTLKGYIAPEQIDYTLRTGRADLVAIFADDYDRRMLSGNATAVQLVADASNTNNATAASAYLQSILLSGTPAAAAQPETRLMYNPQMKSAYNFVPGIMGLIFILICSMMTSISIVREKESGTMEVLLVSPVKPVWIVFAKMIPYFVLSCMNLATILLLSRYLLGVPMSGSVTGLILLTLIYIALSLALGLLISTLADKQITAMIISGMLLMMPIIMFSGMIFPVENMPVVLQGVSCIIPARWYIAAVRKLMIEGLPMREVLNEAAILVTMTGVLITVALRKFNDKLE